MAVVCFSLGKRDCDADVLLGGDTIYVVCQNLVWPWSWWVDRRGAVVSFGDRACEIEGDGSEYLYGAFAFVPYAW